MTWEDYIYYICEGKDVFKNYMPRIIPSEKGWLYYCLHFPEAFHSFKLYPICHPESTGSPSLTARILILFPYSIYEENMKNRWSFLDKKQHVFFFKEKKYIVQLFAFWKSTLWETTMLVENFQTYEENINIKTSVGN